MTKKLIVATSQFAVDSNINKKPDYCKKQIKTAANEKADILHYCECSLSVFAGIDFREFTVDANRKIQVGISRNCKQAKLHNIWVFFRTHLFEAKIRTITQI